jgi:hypothetical protein
MSALSTGVHKSRVTECCMVVPVVFSIVIAVFFITYRNAYYFSCTGQTMPDKHGGYKSFQNFGSSVWNLLPVTFLASSIWRWLMGFRKICGPLTVYIKGVIILPYLHLWAWIYITYCSEQSVFKNRLQWEYLDLRKKVTGGRRKWRKEVFGDLCSHPYVIRASNEGDCDMAGIGGVEMCETFCSGTWKEERLFRGIGLHEGIMWR